MFYRWLFKPSRYFIYLNPNYEKECETYKNYKINEVLKGFLTNFYEHFAFCFNGNFQPGKKFYHVIRMRGQIENYKKDRYLFFKPS